MNGLLHSELEARERLVDEAATDDFAELTRIAGLDPKKHLRFADWSGVDFGGSDLRGFDFTGARLIGCNFQDARIEGARFDQALIDEVRPGAKLDPNRTNLRAAEDWEIYANAWKRRNKRAPEHLPPGFVFQDAPFAPEMVVVPAGRFMMLSDAGWVAQQRGAGHAVTISRALAVGRFPVTSEEWDAARTAGGLKRGPGKKGGGRERQSIVNVSWHNAQAYVAWLSGKTGKSYRLLSEAEWDYACRATFGLYGINGKVWEWCEDYWHKSCADKPKELRQSGGAWKTGDGSLRVLRGGPHHPKNVAKRLGHNSGLTDDDIGFRVAREIA